MIEMKTAELTGAALDWAVAKALGYECGRLPGRAPSLGCNTPDGRQLVIGRLHGACLVEELKAKFWRASVDWAQGGPLVDEYKIWVSGPIFRREEWSAAVDTGTDEMRGPTALVAICRALVLHVLGDVVQVPAELGVPL